MKTTTIIRFILAIVIATVGYAGALPGIAVFPVLFMGACLFLVSPEEFTKPIPRNEWGLTFLLIGILLAVLLTAPFLHLHLSEPHGTIRLVMWAAMWVVSVWAIYSRWKREKRKSNA